MLGIGAMGHGMAISALRAGIPTIVWDRRPAAAQDLAGLGAEVAATAADAAGRAGVVVTMVTDADTVMSIARDQGMLAALAGGIWAQMSTIGVAGTERVAAMVRDDRPDVLLLDAPVSGSRQPAEQGQLTIFASGPLAARPRVAALFDAFAQRTVWVGEVGAGSRLKLVNNTLVAFASEAVATSVALARRLGLETQTVVDALGGSPLLSAWQTAKLQRIAKGEFSAQFALSLALKDVRLALQAAGDDRFTALAGPADEWQRAVEQGLGGQDLTVVTRPLEQREGGHGPDRLHHAVRAGRSQAAGPRRRFGRGSRVRLRGDQRPLLSLAGLARPRPVRVERARRGRPGDRPDSADDLRHLPDPSLSPRRGRPEGGDHATALRRTLHSGAWRGREPQRAHHRRALAAGRGAPPDARGGRADHPRPGRAARSPMGADTSRWRPPRSGTCRRPPRRSASRCRDRKAAGWRDATPTP